MNNRQSKLLKQIEKEAVRVFWEEAFGGKSYGSKHLFRVNRIAGHLWEREGGDEFVVLAGAWVHDVSLVQGDDNDPADVAAFTRYFLKQFEGLSVDEIDRVVECARGHEIGCKGLSPEAKIVHDADVVDKSGMLGVIRHVWKMTNMLESKILNKEDALKKLGAHLRERESKLFTSTAKNLVRNLSRFRDLFFKDKQFALKTITWISNLAYQGVITDEIAERLLLKNHHQSIHILKDQLSCNYLR